MPNRKQPTQRGGLRSRLRRGMGVIDVIVSVALMSVVLAIVSQMSAAIMKYRTNVAGQRNHSEAVGNLMEVMYSLPFERVNEQTLGEIASDISAGEWTIRVEEQTQEIGEQSVSAKKISVQLKKGKSSKLDKLRPPLVAWRYPSAADEPAQVEAVE